MISGKRHGSGGWRLNSDGEFMVGVVLHVSQFSMVARGCQVENVAYCIKCDIFLGLAQVVSAAGGESSRLVWAAARDPVGWRSRCPGAGDRASRGPGLRTGSQRLVRFLLGRKSRGGSGGWRGAGARPPLQGGPCSSPPPAPASPSTFPTQQKTHQPLRARPQPWPATRPIARPRAARAPADRVPSRSPNQP